MEYNNAGEIARQANWKTPHVNPEEVINSALAYGQIGRVPWALVERGDGMVLAIGRENIPIDTPAEAEAARHLAKCLWPIWR